MPYSGNSHKSRQEAGTKSDSRKAKKETVRDGKKGVGKQSRILYSKERTEKRKYKRLKWKGTVTWHTAGGVNRPSIKTLSIIVV